MDVSAVLLREAQQEIAALRTDLFNTRRLAEERRQQLGTLQQERETLSSRLADAEGAVQLLPGVQARCAQLQGALAQLQAEHDTAVGARRILEQELSEERRQRAAVAEQKALLEADKSRLAKLRDDLAAQLRLAQRKAKDAEEEQLRAEDEAATLRAELAALQAASGSFGASGGTGGGGADAAALQPLRDQIEYERNRAAVLLSGLHAAKAHSAELEHQLQAQAHQLQLQLHQDGQADAKADEQLRAHVAALQGELAGSQADLSRAQAHMNELLAERGRLRDALANQQQQHAAAQPAASAVPSHVRHGEPDHGGNSIHAYGSSSQLSDAAAAADGPDGVGRLLHQVGRLRASRDKLLQQVDQQWAEIERLSNESAGLAEELRASRALAANWEAQVQEGLQQIDRLKDLLEESATWSTLSTQPAGPGAAAAPAASGAGAATEAPQVQVLQSQLLGEKAKASELDVQLRAVVAELLRSQHANMALGKTFLPLLTGVERRLGDLCLKSSPARAPGEAWPA